MPKRREPLPAELLPTIPPIVARLLVEVSGPNIRPKGAAPVEVVLHHARLHAGRPRLGVEVEDPVHVAREVQHDAGPDGLPRQRGAGAARRHGDAELAGDPHRRGDVVGVEREDHSDGMIAYMLASRENR
jgi:hypothetical protein